MYVYRTQFREEYTQLFSVRSTPRNFPSSVEVVGAYVAAVPWFWRFLADLSAQSPGLILGQTMLDDVDTQSFVGTD